MTISFFSLGAEGRIKKTNVLFKLNKLIKWERIAEKLKKFHKKDIEDNGGQRPYDPLKMFKAILLGQWYNLSDLSLEEALNVRIDFMLFTDLELSESCPDETTLCRFRNILIKKGLYKELFEEINNQLENFGIKVKEANGAIIDATIIESAARPRKQIEIQEDRKEKVNGFNYTISESSDPDAKWLKKGKRNYFGYKGFFSVDSDKGFINTVHVTSANVAENTQFSNLVEENKCERIYTDKAYASTENRTLLKKKKLKDGIMRKKPQGKDLSFWEKIRNRLISKKRYIVEQCFGTLKRKFKLYRASYIGSEKVKAQLYFKAMCFNLLKAVNMMVET